MRRHLLLLAALTLLVAACGGGSGDTTTTTASAEPSSTTTTADTAEETTTTSAPAAGGAATFTTGDGTEARFVIGEVLAGNDNTVVGANTGVDATMTVDFDAGTVEIGTVTIDAAGFVTDEDRRDGAIRRFILDTADFPEITFTATDTSALTPEGGTVTGDLTVRDVTVPVTFDVTVDQASPDGITATATATVDRTEWDLNIPSVPIVASVEDEVALELDLVLTPTA